MNNWDDTYFPLIADEVGNHIATVAACEEEKMKARSKLIIAAPKMLYLFEMLCFEKSVSRCKFRPEACSNCPIRQIIDDAGGEPCRG